MRVGNGFAILVHGVGNHAFAGGDHRCFGFGAGNQAVQPRLETQAVLDDDLGLEQCLGVIRRGFIGMGVGVRADHVADLDMLATDLVGDVIENTEAGDYLEFVGGVSHRNRQQQTEQHE